MKTRAVGCLVLLLALFANAGWAGEGVIEINQASVLAAGGFPFTINQSGSYRLTSDLVVPDVNKGGIVISSKSVTLDLGGFGIRGPVTCTDDGFASRKNSACSPVGNGKGISVSAGTAVIRNGFVRGMGSSGISISSGLSTIVEHVVVEENGSHGIILNAGLLVDSAVRFNGGDGVWYCDCGFGAPSQIERNVVERNRGAGIHLGRGAVKENLIFFNGGAGVLAVAFAGNAPNVVGNTIYSNTGNGISAPEGIYRDNLLRSNGTTPSGHQVAGSITDGGGNSCAPAC